MTQLRKERTAAVPEKEVAVFYWREPPPRSGVWHDMGDEHHHSDNRLADAISLLARELHALAHNNPVLLRIDQLENTIMSAISDFTAKLNAFFDRQDTAVADLQGDVKNLTDQIAALQASAGAITPADQALLDGIHARASTVADKLDALDALTPPVAPTPPATP